MRKIRVSGCLNCPYMKRFVSTVSKNEIYLCVHPSFDRANRPEINKKYIEKTDYSQEEYKRKARS